jgi:hypothetical protein
MRDYRHMLLSEYVEGMSVIFQRTDTPVLRGDIEGGFDYLCGDCSDMILIENTVEGEVFDIGIVCHRCEKLNLAPMRPPGFPLPKRTTKLRAGLSETYETVAIPRGDVFVSERVADGIRLERGEQPEAPYIVDTPADIERLIGDIHHLLGGVFDKLEQSDRRAVAQGASHARYRHPLMLLIERARTSAVKMHFGRRLDDLSAVSQLATILALYEQYSHHPGWREVRTGATTGHTFVHDIVTLSFVTMTQAGMAGASIQVQDSYKQRIADVLISVSSHSFVRVEIKTHHLLSDPHRSLSAEEAGDVVRKAFKRASTGSSGQLNPQQPALLIVGDLDLSPNNKLLLVEAGKSWFERRAARGGHVYGLGFLWLSQSNDPNYSRFMLLDRLEFSYRRGDVQHTAINFGWLENPYYTGHIRIRDIPGA